MAHTVVISLISVGVGWVLAQGTAAVRDWRTARALRSGLIAELEDIQQQLRSVELIHARQLQISALRGMEPRAALPIPNMLFSECFRDAFRHLNREQRISYQLIHASLAALNRQNESLAAYFEREYERFCSAPDSPAAEAAVRFWGDRVEALYTAARVVGWHVAYHLQHPRSPVLDFGGPVHQKYLEFQRQLKLEVAEIKSKAKTLTREDFEKI